MQRVEVAAVMLRQLERHSEIFMRRRPVGHARAVERKLLYFHFQFTSTSPS